MTEESNTIRQAQSPETHQWLGRFLLHSPNFLRALRGFPLVGQAIHKLSHRLVRKDEKVWAQVQQGPARGLWLELNPRTGQNYLRGEVESATQSILQERLRPGQFFYDLGANIGLFSLLAARIVGPAGKVFSFEPDPEVAARLKRNVDRNGFTNVTIVQAGVWSTSGRRIFQPASVSSPDRGLGKFASDEDAVDGVALECVALDDFTASEPPSDAIKCDVEGAEVEVLRGAEQLLRTRRPWIVCEIHSEANGRCVRELLGRAGYRVHSLDESHIMAAPN